MARSFDVAAAQVGPIVDLADVGGGRGRRQRLAARHLHHHVVVVLREGRVRVRGARARSGWNPVVPLHAHGRLHTLSQPGHLFLLRMITATSQLFSLVVDPFAQFDELEE